MAVKPYLTCKICEKDFSGPEPFAQHCVSKSHLKKVSEEEAARVPSPADNRASGHKYRCEVCQVDMSGATPLQQHMEGGKHKAMLNKKRIIDEQCVPATPTAASNIPNVLKCQTCEKNFSGPESYEQHMVSKKHQRKVQMGDLKNRLTSSGSASCPPSHAENGDQPMIQEGRMYPSLPTPAKPGYPTRASAETVSRKKTTGCFSGFKTVFHLKKKKQDQKK